MKKKAIFFTFIAITMVAIFALIFTPQTDISLQKDTNAVRIRISSVDDYVGDLQNSYFEKILRASTYKTISSLIFYVNSTGTYIPNLDSAFYEVILNGTINKVSIDSITGKKIMYNSTLINWSQMIIKVAKDTLNVNTTIVIENVSVYQTKPWSIDSRLVLSFDVLSNAAEWARKNVSIITEISIEGLYDPYYLVNTNRKYTNQIKKSSLDNNKWNISNLRDQLRNDTYIHWQQSGAPTFLMRFTNTTTNSSCCGIESLVNPNKLSQSDQRESYVDYLFWSHTYNNPANCTQLYNITNPSTGGGIWDEFRYFKLDLIHVVEYRIKNQDIIGNC